MPACSYLEIGGTSNSDRDRPLLATHILYLTEEEDPIGTKVILIYINMYFRSRTVYTCGTQTIPRSIYLKGAIKNLPGFDYDWPTDFRCYHPCQIVIFWKPKKQGAGGTFSWARNQHGGCSLFLISFQKQRLQNQGHSITSRGSRVFGEIDDGEKSGTITGHT